MKTSQEFVILEILAVHNLETDFADYRDVGRIHEDNVEYSVGKVDWEFTFNGLITFLLHILHRLNLALFEYELGGNLGIGVALHIHTVLPIVETCVVHPAEAGNRLVIVKELELDGVAVLNLLVLIGRGSIPSILLVSCLS